MTVGLYGVAVFLYFWSLYVYLPTLPTYVQSKSDNLALVGVVLSVFGLCQAFMRLPLGIAAGVPSPRWLLALAAGHKIEVPPLGSYQVALYLTRFDDSFFLTDP